jgi:hypothetical protein
MKWRVGHWQGSFIAFQIQGTYGFTYGIPR